MSPAEATERLTFFVAALGSGPLWLHPEGDLFSKDALVRRSS